MTEKDGFEADVDDGVDEEFEKAPPAKKSGGGFLKFIVFLAVVAGGAYFGSAKLGIPLPFLSQSGTPAQPAAETAELSPQPEPQVETLAAVIPAASPDALAPPLQDVTATEAIPPQPVPVSGDDPLAAVTAESPNTDPGITPPGSGTSAAAVEAPAASDVALQPDPLAQDVATGQESAALPVPAGSPPAVDPAADPLGAALPESSVPVMPAPETAQEDVVPADSLSALQAASAPAAETAGSDQKYETLEKRLGALEGQIEALQASVVTRTDLESLRAEIAKVAAVEAKKGDQEAVRKARREVQNYRAGRAPEVVKAYGDRKPEATPAKVSLSPRWVLKSAKPGTAWVAEKGSNELKTVTVGDTLSGIGRITAIARDSAGGWVVNGTRGKINQ